MDILIKNSFEILGLDPSDSQQDIEQAYRDLVQVWHPDRFSNNPRLREKSEKKLKEINYAYEILNHYESSLREQADDFNGHSDNSEGADESEQWEDFDDFDDLDDFDIQENTEFSDSDQSANFNSETNIPDLVFVGLLIFCVFLTAIVFFCIIFEDDLFPIKSAKSSPKTHTNSFSGSTAKEAVKAVKNRNQTSETQVAEEGSATSPKDIPLVIREPQKVVVDISAFWDAALDGNIEAVQQALNGGMDVNAVDDQQRTALMLAAFNGHTPIAKLLVVQGASVDARDAMGRTALMFAATGENAETVKLLIDAGAAVNAVDSGEKFTSLMHAAAEGQLEVVRILLEHNADPSLRDIDGDSALDFAYRNAHTEVVKLLAE